MTWYRKVGLRPAASRSPSKGLMQVIDHAPWRTTWPANPREYYETMQRYAHKES